MIPTTGKPFGSLPIWLTLIAVLTAAVGCGRGGPDVWPVTGIVFFDGNPLEGAIVAFQPKEGRQCMALTDKNGEFELIFNRHRKGAPAGEHQVRIYFDAGLQPDKPPSVTIPKKYNSDTELRYEVLEQDNHAEFRLESKSAGKKKTR